MNTLDLRLEQAKGALEHAEYVLIGGGSGLSTAAGLAYDGPRFQTHFGPFIEKYGMTDLYSSGFYPFPTQEEKWAYWAKHIKLNRYDTPATELYRVLLRLVEGKQYFVITTNVDGQFAKAGFPAEKIFATQGDYRFLQCATPCHDRLYDNEVLVHEMEIRTKDCKIPSQLVPKCPVCGGDMEVNLRCDDRFVEDEFWHQARQRYMDFLARTSGRRLVLLELGVGYQTPVIIRFLFEQLTYQNENASLIRLNKGYPDGAEENRSRTISFPEDMMEVLTAL